MLSPIVAVRLKHVQSRIIERDIDIDLEYCVYIAEKCDIDTAIFLGVKEYLGDECHVILIVRGKMPITIECRRTTQRCDCKSLGVQKIEYVSAL